MPGWSGKAENLEGTGGFERKPFTESPDSVGAGGALFREQRQASGWFAFSLFCLLLTMHCSVRTSVFPHSCQEGALMYGVRAQSMARPPRQFGWLWIASLCLRVLLDLNSIGRCSRKIGSGELAATDLSHTLPVLPHHCCSTDDNKGEQAGVSGGCPDPGSPPCSLSLPIALPPTRFPLIPD